MILESQLEQIKSQTERAEPKARDIFNKQNLHIILKFEGVVCKTNIKTGARFFSRAAKSKQKCIVKGVTGAVLPGELLAILGPSGCGKTTLLSALGGRPTGETGGRITYNGRSFSSEIKRNIGFVAQESIFYPHLSVYETLVCVAFLRLPNSFTKDEKIMQAESVISRLGLTKCSNTVVGGHCIKGISGGERKRLSIGQELLINPGLLFLDEPTGGLDSTIAKRIVMILRELAENGRTVVMTIHQPPSSVFYVFDKLMLLAEGWSLYFGKARNAMDYFNKIGFAPSVAMNPSDFLVDIASGMSFGNGEEDHDSIKKILLSSYTNNLEDNLRLELQHMCVDKGASFEEKVTAQMNTTWWQQVVVLLRRDLKQRRHELFSLFTLGKVLVISLVTSLLWWNSSAADLLDQIGLLFFYSKFGGLFPFLQAIFTFPAERKMLVKESSSGMYKLSAYFMARIASDLPLALLYPAIFITTTYWTAGFKQTAGNFFYTLFVVLYTSLVAQGLGFAIGASIMNEKAAITLGSIITLVSSLSGGFIIQHVPAFISWIKYLFLTYYSFKLLLTSQYKVDDTYSCGSNETCLVGDFPRIKAVGLEGQAFAIAALSAMLIAFRFVAYIALLKLSAAAQK